MVTYATWNPSNKHSSITLSGGNLIETNASTTNWIGAGATIGVSSGKWYWEVKGITGAGGGPLIGIINSSVNMATYSLIGTDTNSRGYLGSNGQLYYNGGRTAYGATFTIDDVMGVALDMDAGTLEFFKNNVSQGVAWTGITGTIYPAGQVDGTVGYGITANFGATTMAYTAPAGYNQGLYTIGVVKVLVVAGGGSGSIGRTGTRYSAGGAGGKVTYDSAYAVTAQAYDVVVGVGGASLNSYSQLDTNGNQGGTSSFNTTLIAVGGTGGAYTGTGGASGKTIDGTPTNYTGGTYSGLYGGGGAGSGTNGGNASANTGGNGGDGYQRAINSSYYGGGGGGTTGTLGVGGVGGNGGGGDGAIQSPAVPPGAGTDGLGGGGGGGAFQGYDSGKGGDGVVIIAYATDGSDGISPSSTGGTKTTSGDQTIHTFTSSGTFVAKAFQSVAVLVVAGGGSGGVRVGGGGGAGGLVYDDAHIVSPGAYAVTVGSGGAAVSQVNAVGNYGNDGANSTFDTITANGGGGGGRYPAGAGRNGGSGGGAGGIQAAAGGTATQTDSGGGTGYGNDGGTNATSANGSGGGGAGTAGTAGATGAPDTGGTGGTGMDFSSIFGTGVGDSGLFAGGGGGSGYGGGGAGGSGGGANGAKCSDNSTADSGVDGTGGGGGGGGGASDTGTEWSGKGGDGTVVIAYKTDGSDGIDPSSTGGTKTTFGLYTVHTFTTDGTWTMVPYSPSTYHAVSFSSVTNI